ncbi:MAG: hypothetical protein ACREH8_20095 [Opitutaceae bacterium]
MTIKWTSPAVMLIGGVLLGYMFSRQLDNFPVINRLPKVRL